MKSFSAWPRWVQILVVSLALLAALAAGVAAEYRAMMPRTQGKSALAQQFEAGPKPWLAQPRDASDLERSLAARDVAAIGVDERRLFVTTRGNERYSVEVLPGKEGGQARLEALSREQGFALTRVSVDARSPREKLVAAAGNVMDRGAGVLPVPGGPSSSTPRGGLAPSARYFCGLRMKAVTCCRAALASVEPMTSSKFVCGFSASCSLLPLPMAPELRMT